MHLESNFSEKGQEFLKVVPHRSREMEHCIQSCTECHAVCTKTITYCLEKGGEHASAKHIQTLADCAEICALSAGFMLKNSDHHTVTCGACAEICIKCAESCEAMGDDAVMKACAAVCRRCAKSCAEMAAAWPKTT